jgi:hypothetical protein
MQLVDKHLNQQGPASEVSE